MPALSDITPVILTYNESANIGRCLDMLKWAQRIVVVDSGSDDDTRRIAMTYANVAFFMRTFDTHSRQWSYAVNETGVATAWVLALDADYLVSAHAANWIAGFDDPGIVAVSFPFQYAVNGRILRSGIYPPATVLYRPAFGSYVQDGHTQRLVVKGATVKAPVPMIHDDRKPLDQWFRTQSRYAQLEAKKLCDEGGGLKGWLRTHTPMLPLLIAIHCLVVRGGILDGPHGWLYALQRAVAEGMISVAFLHNKLQRKIGSDGGRENP